MPPPDRPTLERSPNHATCYAPSRGLEKSTGRLTPDCCRDRAALRLYGIQATARSLQLLAQVIATEPRVTAEFLTAVPSLGAPHHLASRIKSPESLARKLFDRQDQRRWWRVPEDHLRYTVLTEVPDKLAATARQTAGELTRTGWQVTYAIQSSTDGSRYKGIHTFLKTSTADRVEVQFHSAQSAKVKEMTTPYYEIERSAQSTVRRHQPSQPRRGPLHGRRL
jgi:hypothetical protein